MQKGFLFFIILSILAPVISFGAMSSNIVGGLVRNALFGWQNTSVNLLKEEATIYCWVEERDKSICQNFIGNMVKDLPDIKFKVAIFTPKDYPNVPSINGKKIGETKETNHNFTIIHGNGQIEYFDWKDTKPPISKLPVDRQKLLTSLQNSIIRISQSASKKTPRVGIAPLPDPDRPYESTDIRTHDTAAFIRRNRDIIIKQLNLVANRGVSNDELKSRLNIIRDAVRLIRTHSIGASTYFFGESYYISKADLRLLEDYEAALGNVISKLK